MPLNFVGMAWDLNFPTHRFCIVDGTALSLVGLEILVNFTKPQFLQCDWVDCAFRV